MSNTIKKEDTEKLIKNLQNAVDIYLPYITHEEETQEIYCTLCDLVTYFRKQQTEAETEDETPTPIVEEKRCTDCDWFGSEWKDYYDGDNWNEIEVYICEMNGERLDCDDLDATYCIRYHNSFEANEEE